MAALDKKRNLVEIYQIGKITKGGFPVAREQSALGDIMKWANEKELEELTLSFLPYNLP